MLAVPICAMPRIGGSGASLVHKETLGLDNPRQGLNVVSSADALLVVVSSPSKASHAQYSKSSRFVHFKFHSILCASTCERQRSTMLPLHRGRSRSHTSHTQQLCIRRRSGHRQRARLCQNHEVYDVYGGCRRSSEPLIALPQVKCHLTSQPSECP